MTTGPLPPFPSSSWIFFEKTSWLLNSLNVNSHLHGAVVVASERVHALQAYQAEVAQHAQHVGLALHKAV